MARKIKVMMGIYSMTTKVQDMELYQELFINEATHQDLDSGEFLHIDNAILVLCGDEWIEEVEPKLRRLKEI